LPRCGIGASFDTVSVDKTAAAFVIAPSILRLPVSLLVISASALESAGPPESGKSRQREDRVVEGTVSTVAGAIVVTVAGAVVVTVVVSIVATAVLVVTADTVLSSSPHADAVMNAMSAAMLRARAREPLGLHVIVASYEQSRSCMNNLRTYSTRMPLIARAMTSRWISDVPSKIV
jgi:hypothetical protein